MWWISHIKLTQIKGFRSVFYSHFLPLDEIYNFNSSFCVIPKDLHAKNQAVAHLFVTGEKGLFAFAPPHQGVDGEWSDKSGVIVYRWNDKDNRPNTGISNWKKRWSCCSEYDEHAPPCQLGRHVSYDDGYTMF